MYISASSFQLDSAVVPSAITGVPQENSRLLATKRLHIALIQSKSPLTEPDGQNHLVEYVQALSKLVPDMLPRRMPPGRSRWMGRAKGGSMPFCRLRCLKPAVQDCRGPFEMVRCDTQGPSHSGKWMFPTCMLGSLVLDCLKVFIAM